MSNLSQQATIRLRETAGPTILALGAIADEQVLIRRGSSVIGTDSITVASDGTVTVTKDLFISNGSGLVIGHNAKITAGNVPEFQVLGAGGPDSAALAGRWSANEFGPAFDFVKSRNAVIGSNSIVQDGDTIGRSRFFPDDGASFSTMAASFSALVDDASPAVGDIGMAFFWRQMPGDGGALRDTMQLNAAGQLGVGVTPTSVLSMRMGTGAGASQASAKANVNTTAAGTPASTVETVLITYSLPANSLSADGKLVKISAWGSVAANGNTKIIRLRFGATIIRQIGPSGMSGLDWRIDGLVVRTGAAAQDAMATEFLDTSVQDTTISTPAETLSGAVVIKITGENGVASANDIVAEGMLVEYLN